MDVQEALNELAWRDFILFAWSQGDAHAAFRSASGRSQRSTKTNSALGLLIDRAVGGAEDDRYMEEFVNWVTKNHWGENYAPEKWRNQRAAYRQAKGGVR
jgi:hypothetical protein